MEPGQLLRVPQLGQFSQITGAEVVDGNKVKLTTDGPYPALMAQLVKLSIVPQAVVEAVGAEAFNAAPVGSGPYKFTEWNRGISVTLARNEGYWGAAGPFDTAVFRAVPDAVTRVADLQAGTSDLVVSIDSDAAARAITAARPELVATPVVFGTAPVFDQRVVQALQQMLNDVGFSVEISMTDMPTYLAAARADDRASRPGLTFGRWSCACQDVDGIAYPLLKSDSSWSWVNAPKIDALLEQARVSLDEEVRLDAYAEVAKIVRENYYVLPMYQAAVLYGAAADLTFEPTANESMFLNRMTWAE